MVIIILLSIYYFQIVKEQGCIAERYFQQPMNINTALEFMTIPVYHLLSPEMLEALNISKVLERYF